MHLHLYLHLHFRHHHQPSPSTITISIAIIIIAQWSSALNFAILSSSVVTWKSGLVALFYNQLPVSCTSTITNLIWFYFFQLFLLLLFLFLLLVFIFFIDFSTKHTSPIDVTVHREFKIWICFSISNKFFFVCF